MSETLPVAATLAGNRESNGQGLGLVLSGGGAKGAYQVGVMKALLELELPISLIAGTSIGALNGAVLASAPSLREGVVRLERLWMTLAEKSPIEANWPSYPKLLAAVGLTISPILLGGLASFFAKGITAVSAVKHAGDASILNDEPLMKLMQEYLDMEGLQNGVPFYVSVYESQGGIMDVLRCGVAELGLKDTPPSRFLHLQSLAEPERKNVLLASAALPILYKSRIIEGKFYSDGGQGGWNKVQGNTPITPLIEAGCKEIIVVHLSDGSLWSRHDYPDTKIIEIRPQAPLVSQDGLLAAGKAALGFDSENIERLMSQGYFDTKHCIGRVIAAGETLAHLRKTENLMQGNFLVGRQADEELGQMMKKLV